VVLGGVSGCGNAIYIAKLSQASEEVSRAEERGAAQKAPYEYYYAVEHLKKAKQEATEADYGAAATLAEIAYHHAARALQVVERGVATDDAAGDLP
jgi:hypothetical protein